MERNWGKELEARVEWIRGRLAAAGAHGIVYGNSGGKDSALVGILCKKACDSTVGIIMPCESKRNFGMDAEDGRQVAEKFNIETRLLDLTAVKKLEVELLGGITTVSHMARANIAPRLRMITLYGVAASENRLVAGTGNRSEAYVGYFTKYGDGGYDINPIGDLTVGEIYGFLRWLDAPKAIIEKAPSAGLFEGQTDEAEMGLAYADIDRYILTGQAEPAVAEKIDKRHAASEHKRCLPAVYNG